MSSDQEDALFAEEMFLSRLRFDAAVHHALMSTHIVVHTACAASSARARTLIESSALLRHRCRAARAEAAALRDELAAICSSASTISSC